MQPLRLNAGDSSLIVVSAVLHRPWRGDKIEVPSSLHIINCSLAVHRCR